MGSSVRWALRPMRMRWSLLSWYARRWRSRRQWIKPLRELMARAYTKHGFATMFVRLRVTRALRVFPFVAETLNAGEHAGTYTFGELLPIHDFIISQRRPKQA